MNPVHKKGFTLAEVLVAVSVFSILVVIMSSAFIHALKIQRYNLAHQGLLDQTSFAMEYMSRHIRMAKTRIAGMSNLACNNVDPNRNYHVDGGTIQFIQYRYESGQVNPTLVCTEFSLSGGRLRETVRDMNTGAEIFESYLTSDNLAVTNFEVQVEDELQKQPLVEINLDIEHDADDTIKIEIQTSISQRDLNF